MGPFEAALRKAHLERKQKFFPAPAKVLEELTKPPPEKKPDKQPAGELVVFPPSIRAQLETTHPPRPEIIQAIVALHYGLHRKEMLSPRRAKALVWPRQVAMALCAELIPSATLPMVGRWFGRDHTTVLHARRKVAERAAGDPRIAEQVQVVRAKLQAFLEPQVNNLTAGLL